MPGQLGLRKERRALLREKGKAPQDPRTGRLGWGFIRGNSRGLRPEQRVGMGWRAGLGQGQQDFDALGSAVVPHSAEFCDFNQESDVSPLEGA